MNDIDLSVQKEIDEIEEAALAGTLTRQDLEQAARTRLNAWQNAAEQGLPQAQWLMATFAESGVGVARNTDEAVRWYRKAAESGHAESQWVLGCWYREGSGIAKDESEAVRWYRSAAEQGHTAAQVSLALCYLGAGVKEDLVEFLCWSLIAADKGDNSAKKNLASVFRGTSVKPGEDVGKEISLLTEFAARRSVEACRLLADFYWFGRGVEKNAYKALDWYKKAAELGDGKSCEMIGFIYRDGASLPKDLYQAFHWLRKAAELNPSDVALQLEIGKMYYFGEGTQKNLQEAARRFREAAEQGDKEGQFWLGRVYCTGEGVAKDKQEGLRWLHLAAQQGHTTAKEYLEEQKKSAVWRGLFGRFQW